MSDLSASPENCLAFPTSQEAPSSAALTEQTFQQEFTAIRTRLRAYIIWLTPDAEDQKDLFQETSRVLWKKRTNYQIGSDFRAWAFRIAKLQAKALHKRRQQKREDSYDWDSLTRLEPSLPQDFTDSERHTRLEICLGKLPEKLRGLVELYYQEGYSIPEIAQLQHKPKTGLFKAFQRLHRSLHDCMTSSVK